MSKKRCNLGLHTRVKDKRNIVANLSHYYDTTQNEIYTEDDDKKKCEIFKIPNIKTDFITKEKMTGVGDHYYLLCADLKKKQIIGSDSNWNIIPVSGYNSSYKKDVIYNKIINEWKEYVEERNGKMFYTLTKEHICLFDEQEKIFVQQNNETFKKLCLIKIC